MLLADTDCKKNDIKLSQGQSGQKENWFWLIAGENIGFVTQYLANIRILGDA